MIILGCPLKISSQKTIYFPKLYLEYFKIDTRNDIVIRENHSDYFIYRPYSERLLADNEQKSIIRACSTYIPVEFLHQNRLVPGQDSLYLIGIDHGMKVSTNRKII